MSKRPLELAGMALTWQGIQLVVLQLIFLLRILILARLLSPEDFGLLTIAATAIGFLLSVSNLGMVPALVQGMEVDEQMYDAAWTVGVLRALFIGGIVALFAAPIAQIFGEPAAIPIIRVLALRPVLESLASIKIARLNRNLQFRPLTLVKLADAVVNTLVSIGLATTLGVWSLVAGALSGAGITLVASYVVAPHRPQFRFGWSDAVPLFRFGRWIFMTAMVAMLGHSVLRVVITRQLGVAELGLYYLATQIAFLPGSISSEVVGAVLFPLISRLQADVEQAVAVFKAVVIGMAALLFPACALIFALAPVLVETVLGPRWIGTEPAIRVLVLATLLGIFGDAVSPLLKGFGEPQKDTAIVVIHSLVLAGSAWLLAGAYGLAGATMGWLLASAVAQLLAALFVRRRLAGSLAGLATPLAIILCIAWVAAAAAWGVSVWLSGIVGLILAVVAGLGVTVVLLWVGDRYPGFGLLDSVDLIFPQLAVRRRLAAIHVQPSKG